MWFLCVFYHRLLDYRKPEVESLADLFGAFDKEADPESKSLEWRLPETHHPDSPFHFVNLPSEEIARQIANRSILVKGIYELWGEGINFEELEEAIKGYPEERKLPYLTSESTFKITVDSFGKVISFQEQNERIRSLSYIPFKGRVNLKDPDHKFWLMETDDYGSNNGLPPILQRRIFFGREIGAADRKLLPTYQLKSRTYLGPTAMDAEMAFLMANQAQAKPGKLVYDPFVGTGSILVAAAHFGAMTMGADIDIRVVRDGRGPNCNVWSNFKQYGLPMPISLLRADNNLPPWRPELKEVFDAIICDPPYGVRAGGRKSGGRKLLKGVIGPYTVPDDKREDHIPSTASYSLAECVHDLLDLAARMLVMGGRLVYFYPVLREDDTININFPEHPCFKLVATCEQILSLRYSRVLLTMVKIGPYTEDFAEAARVKHLEFRENHLKWLEEGNLHSAVLSPADIQLNGAGETKLTEDSLTFLLNWFEKFPQYKTRSLFLTGKSYAGHYVPQLANLILDYNEKSKGFKFNLKGVAIGNPLLNLDQDTSSVYEYFWSHRMISDEIWETVSDECNFFDFTFDNTHNESVACNEALDTAFKIVGDYVNPYDVILDVCYPSIVEQELRLRKMATKISVGVDV